MCRHPFYAMICDIDRAINWYTFFGNGGANLHTKFSETYQITLTMFFLSSLTFKRWVMIPLFSRYMLY